MVTYDILILIAIASLIVGVWVGLLISTYLFEKPIEKSKAKKPTPWNKFDFKGNQYGVSHYECPNCKGLLSQKYEYCHKCGQRLLWESEVQGE